MELDEVEALKAEVRKAAEAQTLVSHPAFQDAFEALRKDLQRQMSAVKPTDEVTKAKLIDMWQLADALEKWFVKTITTGEAAEMQLAERKKWGAFSR